MFVKLKYSKCVGSAYLVQAPGRAALTISPPPPGMMAAMEMVTTGRADPAYRISMVQVNMMATIHQPYLWQSSTLPTA